MTARTPPKVPRPTPVPRTESPLIRELEGRLGGPDADRALRALWQDAAARTPLVEEIDGAPHERIVTFVWRDATAESVLLFANRLTDERSIDDTLLRRLPGTDLWTASFRMGAGWRASYSFLVQEAGQRAPWRTDDDQVALRRALDRGRRDPGNPAVVVNRAGIAQSVVALPDAPRQPWLEVRPDSPRGDVAELTGPGGRRLWVYEPSGATGALPIVVVLDGEVWAAAQSLPATMDNLLADGRVRPARLVMVDSGGTDRRWSELDADGGGARWIAAELVPWLRERYAVTEGARHVAVAGQSLGGYTALRAVLEHPDTVGAALSQSASLWLGGLERHCMPGALGGSRVWLEVGAQEWVLREPHAAFVDALRRSGAEVTFGEYDGGHDYACWRGGIAEGLQAILAP